MLPASSRCSEKHPLNQLAEVGSLRRERSKGSTRVRARNGPIGWLPLVTICYYSLAIVQSLVWTYLRDMNNRNASPELTDESRGLNRSVTGSTANRNSLRRSALGSILTVLAMVTISMAADPPEAPSSSMRSDSAIIEGATPVVRMPASLADRHASKLMDKKFVALAIISGGSTFADSYTTLFARENWLAGKKGVCNVEIQSAYLYGTHPTVGRAYAVATAKSAGSLFAAYYLRKHHNKFWSLPLVANSIMSLQGVSQNMVTCN